MELHSFKMNMTGEKREYNRSKPNKNTQEQTSV